MFRGAGIPVTTETEEKIASHTEQTEMQITINAVKLLCCRTYINLLQTYLMKWSCPASHSHTLPMQPSAPPH